MHFSMFLFVSSMCRTPGIPSPAVDDVCVFFVPNKYQPSIPIEEPSLHGWWPKEIRSPVPSRLTYDEFLGRNNTFPFAFYDTTTWTNTVGCGQYREYVKHGVKSGYDYDQWYNNIILCDYKKAIYPHMCVVHAGVNCLKAVSSVNIGLIGCNPMFPYIICS